MSKFSGPSSAPAQVSAPVATVARTLTHEGGAGWARDAKSDLFLFAVSNMVGEDSFYESHEERDARFRDLVATVVADDPEWVARFVSYLRDVMQMRSASVVMAAEYVRAGGRGGRAVVAAACSRADEPAEILGYWASRYGRRFPKPIKRGVADAAVRLYTERAALRYDGQSRSWRMGDVIDLTHPRPTAEWQSALFGWLLDHRHGRPTNGRIEQLPVVARSLALEAVPAEQRRETLRRVGPDGLAEAGWSWERLAGWLPGGMDAEAWETVIPSMDYMALLRNLRNFDEAGIGAETASLVAARLADADEVARSRQFPIRFLSAWQHTGSMRWGAALEQALETSLANVPNLRGRTLIMVDVSGSMMDTLSGRSQMQRWKVAAVFGFALAKRAEHADVFLYNTQAAAVDDDLSTMSLLRAVDAVQRLIGGGTATMSVLAQLYGGHDRVVILTDEQAYDAGRQLPQIPLVYTFNLAGYGPAHMESGGHGRFTFGGLTDAAFRMLPILESHRYAGWPF